jgi:hypothetical protein
VVGVPWEWGGREMGIVPGPRRMIGSSRIERRSSSNTQRSHIASLEASEAAMYSASFELVATQVCLRTNQMIGPLVARKTDAPIDFLAILWLAVRG